MPRYRPGWLEIVEQLYRNLPDDVRDLVDRRLAHLFENPTADPDAVDNDVSDQWSITLGDHGFLFFAVVRDPATLIVLRLVVGLG